MKKCIICGGDFFDIPIISLNNMPESAQGFLDNKEDNHSITLNLVQCKWCGTIQFDCVAVDYYKDVIRAGGYTKTMSDIREKQFNEFINKFNLYNKKILEIGCGKGEFLNILSKFNVKCYGIENNIDNVNIARMSGLEVKNMFLDDEKSIIDDGPFDAFIQFNFLEHQPDPNSMIRAIYNNLTQNGVGLLTVPSCDYIFNNGAFYELIRDHLIYFTKDSLFLFLQKNGFKVLEYELLNNDTHSVIVQKRKPLSGLKFNNLFNKLYNEINSYINSYKNVVIWGASHQGLTITSCYNLSDKIKYIIDSAPFKQGKFSIGSNIKIISPDEAFKLNIDAVIIIAPGYSKEIENVIKTNMNDKVSIATILFDELIVIR